MNIVGLGYLGLIIGIIGLVSVIAITWVCYVNIKKSDSNGTFKEYLQTPLANSDYSISEAVKYLKIVNASKDVKKPNEHIQ